MNILEINVYCHSDSTVFQDDVPGAPIEVEKVYEIKGDVIPEFSLDKAIINTMDVNADNWFSSRTVLVNDTQALLVDFDGREFYVPYTKEEFRELLQNDGKVDTGLNNFYIGVGITQVLQALEREFGETNAATILVREMYNAQSKLQNGQN